ncbi:WXG100 family type VII secretion target [Amycolatopsis sp. cmx-8-4]|uniref:WXG100 family type VII secretion target n=1 Tax=Amycolatopsis sp. cmx-8-4 TaxID=2790947 RepID=UPI003978B77C
MSDTPTPWTTDSPAPVTPPQAGMPYPTDSDEKIRYWAEFIGAQGIVTLLDKLRVFIAGDIGKVLQLADRFANESALSDAAKQLSEAKLSLSKAWHGDAADQFSDYAGNAVTVLGQNQNSLISLTNTMSAIAQTIIDTYKNLLTTMGKCAINLAQLGGKIGIAVAESTAVPPLAVIGFKDVADAINSAFATFWTDCLTLLGGMMTDIGKQIGNRLQLSIIEANFATLPDVGDSRASSTTRPAGRSSREPPTHDRSPHPLRCPYRPAGFGAECRLLDGSAAGSADPRGRDERGRPVPHRSVRRCHRRAAHRPRFHRR